MPLVTRVVIGVMLGTNIGNKQKKENLFLGKKILKCEITSVGIAANPVLERKQAGYRLHNGATTRLGGLVRCEALSFHLIYAFFIHTSFVYPFFELTCICQFFFVNVKMSRIYVAV